MFTVCYKYTWLFSGKRKVVAYPGDGSQGGLEAQWAGPPAGQRGLEAEAGQAAEALAWLQRILEADSGAELCDLYLLYGEDASLEWNSLLPILKRTL